MEGQKIIMDIVAGQGERLLREAKANSDKRYVIIDQYEPAKQVILPPNLIWYFGGITEEKGIPMSDNAVDEVNLDSCLRDIYAQENYQQLATRLLQEAVRVLKNDGIIYIREPKYMLEFVEPLLIDLDIEYNYEAMPIDIAKSHSESIREAALEFESGYEEMEPFVITAKKLP